MTQDARSLDDTLKDVLRAYRDSFAIKTYSEENDDPDPLMDVFGITPVRKRRIGSTGGGSWVCVGNSW